MSKTHFLLGNLNSKSKNDTEFITREMYKSFEKVKGKIDLVLSPREILLKINPCEISELKKAERLDKFKIKKYYKNKKKYEKMLNRMFNYSGYIPQEYYVSGCEDLFCMNKNRIKLHITPITQKMLCYDWRCKLLLQNSNLGNNEELLNEYIKLRLERTNTFNGEILNFLKTLKNNKIVVLNEINYGITSIYTDEKEIIFPLNSIFISDIIIKKEISKK